VRIVRKLLLIFGLAYLGVFVLIGYLGGRNIPFEDVFAIFILMPILMIVLVVMSYSYADHLGRGGGRWGLFAFFFPFLAPLILALLRAPQNIEQGSPNVERTQGEKDAMGLIELLGDDELSAQALIALVDTKDITVVETLIKALRDENLKVRERVVYVLGQIGDERAVDGLIQAMGDDQINIVAATLFREIDASVSLEPLIKSLKSPDVNRRKGAVCALGNTGGTRAIEALVDALEDEDEGVRAWFPIAFRELGTEGSIEPLIEALRTKDVNGRSAAAQSLAEIPDSRSIEPLTQALHDEDDLVRMFAESSLETIKGALEETEHDVGRQELLQPVQRPSAQKEALQEVGSVTHYSDEWNFSISYPADWEIVYEDEPAGSWTIPIAVAGEQQVGGRPCFMVNVRQGEILQGSGNWKVTSVSADGNITEMPSTPQEYIEMNKEQLPLSFSGYKFISAEEIRLAKKPAATMIYSYDGQEGRIQEECITLFGVGVTFQFICECPAQQFNNVNPVFKSIVESFRIGLATPGETTDTEEEPSTVPAEQSPIQLYNRGARLHRNGEFEQALEVFDQCIHFGDYQMQAAYARALCQLELGLDIEMPEELGDSAEEAGPVYIASNIVCHLVGKGHQVALSKQGKTSEVKANINGTTYLISITSGFGFGGFFKMAWRIEGEKEVPLTDSEANPKPTESDKIVISLLEKASSLPISPIPEAGL
jgi:HEAT repeat protein